MKKIFTLSLCTFFILSPVCAMAPTDNNNHAQTIISQVTHYRRLTMQVLNTMEQQAAKADNTTNRFYIASSIATIATVFLVKNTFPFSTISNIAEATCIATLGSSLTKILYECGKETKREAALYRSAADYHRKRISQTEAPRIQIMIQPPCTRAMLLPSLPPAYEDSESLSTLPSSSEADRRQAQPPAYHE